MIAIGITIIITSINDAKNLENLVANLECNLVSFKVFPFANGYLEK